MGTSRKKGVAPPRYDEAFKAGAIKLVTEQGCPSTEVAKELGICIDTLRSWLKASAGVSTGQGERQNRENPAAAGTGGGGACSAQAGGGERRGHRHPKKIHGYTFKTIEEKYQYVKADRSGASVEELCQALTILPPFPN